MSWDNESSTKSPSLPLNRVFDKFADIICQEWNDTMKVHANPPVVWSRPRYAQDCDTIEAKNNNMNGKFYFPFRKKSFNFFNSISRYY